jgi:hypothetical protein
MPARRRLTFIQYGAIIKGFAHESLMKRSATPEAPPRPFMPNWRLETYL